MCVNKECTQADAVLIPQSFEGKKLNYYLSTGKIIY